MSSQDWRWKIGEVVERVRTRYDFIGRKTGAPFLALVYPPEAEAAFFKEWQAQVSTLCPDFDMRSVNVLEITQGVTADIGAENIVDSLADPMPGSDPQSELGNLWVNAVAETVKSRLAESGPGKPVACMERLAALHPAAGPKAVMQLLWDCAQSLLNGPVIVLIPGYVVESRTYSFLGCRDEFMYRGDLL